MNQVSFRELRVGVAYSRSVCACFMYLHPKCIRHSRDFWFLDYLRSVDRTSDFSMLSLSGAVEPYEGLLARTACQVSAYYEEVSKALGAAPLNGHVDKTWAPNVAVKVRSKDRSVCCTPRRNHRLHSNVTELAQPPSHWVGFMQRYNDSFLCVVAVTSHPSD